jgi:hypothetical protein
MPIEHAPTCTLIGLYDVFDVEACRVEQDRRGIPNVYVLGADRARDQARDTGWYDVRRRPRLSM